MTTLRWTLLSASTLVALLAITPCAVGLSSSNHAYSSRCDAWIKRGAVKLSSAASNAFMRRCPATTVLAAAFTSAFS